MNPLPDVTFENEYTLSHGNQTPQLSYKGPNHQPGTIFIYAPSQKVLMLVDVVFPRWAPFAYLGEAEDVPGFVRAHDEILQYSFKMYLDSVTSYCHDVTNEKWLGRLSGVDVYELENSYAMVAALSETNLGRSSMNLQ